MLPRLKEQGKEKKRVDRGLDSGLRVSPPTLPAKNAGKDGAPLSGDETSPAEALRSELEKKDAEIKRLGMQAMVGTMFGTSLAMGPAFLVGQSCDVVDLDGPMGFVRDRAPAVTYDDGLVWCAPESWGGPAG